MVRTRISLFQFPSSLNLGDQQNSIIVQLVDSKKSYQLPDQFTTVPAIDLKTKTVSVPKKSNALSPMLGQLADAQLKEVSWLKHACA